MRTSSFDPRGLSVRLTLGMLVIMIITLLAIGFPILWLVRNQPAHALLMTETRVWQVLAGTVVVVTALALVLGFILARRITAPLQDLASASESMGRGDLSTPVHSWDSVTEVTLLAGSLERMRSRLRDAHNDLAHSKEWYENLIASLSEGVFTLDSNGRVTSFSPGAERILGWRATDVIGRSFQSVFQSPPLQNPAPGTVIRQAVQNRQAQPLVLLITSGALTQHPDGSSEQAFVLRDATQDEEAMRMREFFLANVSHELKTPLSSLRASIELLAGELASLSPDEQKELVDSLWLGTIRLEELVDNLLSSASIRSGHFQVKARPVELTPILRELVSSTRPLLSLHGQTLQLDLASSLPLVWADPRRLNQVLVNLVSNASKHGPSLQPITIQAQARQDRVTVSVVDCGEPLPSENHLVVFQPFQQGSDSASGGIGLGLSIVRTIVEQQGGEVGIRTPPEGGNAFWFTLRAVNDAGNERA